MEKDKAAIDLAYADTLDNLYTHMFDSYVAANDSEPDEKKADDAFKFGLAIARKVRNRALAML
jgi:hypothetical protein